MTIPKDLLDIMVCPKCKGQIKLTEEEDGLVCEACKLLYPINDGIPMMIIEDAKPLE